ERMHLRPTEADAERLSVLERQPVDFADNRPTLVADWFEIEWLGGIENQPHRVAAAKQGRRRNGRKREGQTQTVAVAPGIDLDRLLGRFRFRRFGFGFGLRRGLRLRLGTFR